MINHENVDMPIHAHTFNRAAERTLKLACEISGNRAGEYRDSWAVENLQTLWVTALLRDYPQAPAKQLERHWKRLIVMASMLDIKLSRLGGPWKQDTGLDSINYMAAYIQLREEFDNEMRNYQPKVVLNGAEFTEAQFQKMNAAVNGYATNVPEKECSPRR